jgi:hypothetical protein
MGSRRTVVLFIVLGLSGALLGGCQKGQHDGQITGRLFDLCERGAAAPEPARKAVISALPCEQDSSGSIKMSYEAVYKGNSPYKATSDANGSFRIKSIPPGSYVLQVSYAGAARLEHAEVLYGDENGPFRMGGGLFLVVTVTAGAAIDIGRLRIVTGWGQRMSDGCSYAVVAGSRLLDGAGGTP